MDSIAGRLPACCVAIEVPQISQWVPFSPAGVCAVVVASVRAAIQRDWARATKDLVRLAGACPEWFRGRSPALSMRKFRARWASNGVLCRVLGADGQRPSLLVRFSLAHPIPAPPPSEPLDAAQVAAELEGSGSL